MNIEHSQELFLWNFCNNFWLMLILFRMPKLRRFIHCKTKIVLQNCVAFLITRRIILLAGFNKSFPQNSVIVSDCESDLKFPKCWEHGNFVVCSSSENSLTKNQNNLWNCLAFSKKYRILPRGLNKTFLQKSVKFQTARHFTSCGCCHIVTTNRK